MNTQSPLLTDLYQLTMAQGYWKNDRTDTEAVFHLFFRRHPFGNDFTIAAGLQPAIEFLKQWRFSTDDLDYLAQLKNPENCPLFSKNFLAYLNSLSFECSIHAVPEGTFMFPLAPLLRIQGPIIQCQLLETALLNFFNLSSLIATKAARVRLAAGEQPIAEFGLRRAQGPNGGVLASRAAYIGGANTTSNVLAGKLFNIPVSGTVAHSWIMSFDSEIEAFQAAADLMGNQTVLLVDTYQTETGVKNAIKTAEYLRSKNQQLYAIRLDSGDLPSLAKKSRQLLDAAGLQSVKIIVSGDLDEYRIAELKQRQAPIDLWGVGTRLLTAFDYPALDITYKLAAIKVKDQWQYKMKTTDDSAKKSMPGILQVRRSFNQEQALGDMIYHELSQPSETPFPDAQYSVDLLQPVFMQGQLVYTSPSTSSIRELAAKQLSVWQQYGQANYPVVMDPILSTLSHPSH